MWWARSEAGAHAWLGAGRAAWRIPGGEHAGVETSSVEEGMAWLAAALKDRRPNGQVRLWLASDVCALACMPAMSGVKRLAEAQAAAVAWLQSEGRIQPGWTARLAECSSGAAVWRLSLSPEGLVEQAGRHLALQSVRPWWSWALQHMEDHRRGLCAYDGAALVFCDWGGAGHVVAAETVGPLGDVAAARRLLKRRSVQRPGEQLVAHIDWGADHDMAANDAEFAFSPWVRWVDAL